MGPPGGLPDGGAELCRTTLRIRQENRARTRHRTPVGAAIVRKRRQRKKIEPSGSTRRNGTASLEGGGQGAVVEIIEFAADRHSLGEAGDLDISPGETVCEIMRRRLT